VDTPIKQWDSEQLVPTPFHVRCNKCTAGVYADTEEEAIATWNKRAPPDRLDAIRKRAEALGEDISLWTQKIELEFKNANSALDTIERSLGNEELSPDYRTCEKCNEKTLHRFGGLCSKCERLDCKGGGE